MHILEVPINSLPSAHKVMKLLTKNNVMKLVVVIIIKLVVIHLVEIIIDVIIYNLHYLNQVTLIVCGNNPNIVIQ